jgi:hypothetical protein
MMITERRSAAEKSTLSNAARSGCSFREAFADSNFICPLRSASYGRTQKERLNQAPLPHSTLR